MALTYKNLLLAGLPDSRIIITWADGNAARSAERLFCYNLERVLEMAATKTVNYTAEQTAEIVSAYMVGDSVESIAEKMGKSVRSIVAKLSREGVYKKKEYVTKTGERAIKKDVHADAIGAILRLPENDIESLTKANKSALKAIFEALAASRPV
jgi:hypothetical protein